MKGGNGKENKPVSALLLSCIIVYFRHPISFQVFQPTNLSLATTEKNEAAIRLLLQSLQNSEFPSAILKGIMQLQIEDLFFNYHLSGRPGITQVPGCLLAFSKNTLYLQEDMTRADLALSYGASPFICGAEKAPPLPPTSLRDDLRASTHRLQK